MIAETQSHGATTPAHPVAETAPAVVPHARRRSRIGRVIGWILAAAVATCAAVAAFHPPTNARAMELYHKLTGAKPAESEKAQAEEPAPPNVPFNGHLRITKVQAESLGLTTTAVGAQTDPIRLSVAGRTEYDPSTLNKVRPKFKSLIDKVYVELGQTVKAGDPLVDLFSADLADAKGVYETKMAQWTHDRAELTRMAELRKTKAASEKEYLSIFNDEQKSGTEAKIARDKLMVLGLSESEIEAVAKEDGTQKAKMTLRAPAGGVVIAKDVVNGNLYGDEDVLLTIAPLDHFWVHGDVYPSDAARVKLGQTWVIDCPFEGHVHRQAIESVASEVDKETKTVVIRTRIENTSGKIKADMLVVGYVEIPPPDGSHRTVIPRTSMITTDGGEYVFVVTNEAQDGTLTFERRKVRVIQEGSEDVILGEQTSAGDSLAAGEKVAVRGSLILMQMYEDAVATE